MTAASSKKGENDMRLWVAVTVDCPYTENGLNLSSITHFCPTTIPIDHVVQGEVTE